MNAQLPLPSGLVGTTIEIAKFGLVAMAVYDDGRVLVLTNNADVFHVAITEDLGGDEATTARVVASYPYDVRFVPAFRAAATKMIAVAASLTIDGEDDDDACPGCGCVAGDGRTPGCSHPDGCGYFAALESKGESR